MKEADVFCRKDFSTDRIDLICTPTIATFVAVNQRLFGKHFVDYRLLILCSHSRLIVVVFVTFFHRRNS